MPCALWLLYAGRKVGLAILCTLCVLGAGGSAAWAQSAGAAKPPVAVPLESSPAQATAKDGSVKPAASSLSAKEMREAQIAADTERLYVLAQELKVEMDKSTKDTLSLTVVRKAAEIEKLAHSLSERMKSN